MAEENRLRLAIQKSGRLSDRSLDLIHKCGIDFEWQGGGLLCRSEDFPIDLMLLRSGDIPEYVRDGVCDLGIVGYNVLEEKVYCHDGRRDGVQVRKNLGFGHCRLSVAVPRSGSYQCLADLNGKRIATSYPNTLSKHLSDQGIKADPVEISGSVEIAPTMGIADAICDLVQTGGTLQSNGLKEISTLLESQAVLIQTARELSPVKQDELNRLLKRVDGVMLAARSKYIMMNAPADAVDEICSIIPGMEKPTVIPLQDGGKGPVAIHAVSPEPVFWETMERLKAAGASSILVVPIEKIVE